MVAIWPSGGNLFTRLSAASLYYSRCKASYVSMHSWPMVWPSLPRVPTAVSSVRPHSVSLQVSLHISLLTACSTQAAMQAARLSSIKRCRQVDRLPLHKHLLSLHQKCSHASRKSSLWRASLAAKTARYSRLGKRAAHRASGVEDARRRALRPQARLADNDQELIRFRIDWRTQRRDCASAC
jgi:hypothetical protein